MKLTFAKATLAALVAIGVTAPKSSAILLGQYTFEGNTSNPSSVQSGLASFSSFSYTSDGTPSSTTGYTVGNPNVSGDPSGRAFFATNWPTSNPFPTNSSSPNGGDYFSYTVTPNSGISVDLTSIEFDNQRSSQGVLNFQVRSSLDNYASPVQPALRIPANTTAFRSNDTITLGSQFSSLSAPVTFRIYGYNASGPSNTWTVDNIQTFGDLTGAQPVPFEFSPGMGILLLGGWGAIAQLTSSLRKLKTSKSAVV